MYFKNDILNLLPAYSTVNIHAPVHRENNPSYQQNDFYHLK